MSHHRFMLSEEERSESRKRARRRAENAMEEREHLRLEINARQLLQEIKNIGDKEYRGDRNAVAEATLKLKAKTTLLDRVLPVLRSQDGDAMFQEQLNQAPVVQVVKFGSGETLGIINPFGDEDRKLLESEPWLN